MTESLTRQQAWERLRDSDHLILEGEEARAIGIGFGVEVRTYAITDTRSAFKGAHLPGVNEGDTVEDMIDAAILGEQLCAALGIEYRQFSGRGFQLRECVRVLAETYQLDTGRPTGGQEL